MSAIKQTNDDQLQLLLATVSQVQQSSVVDPLTNENSLSTFDSADSTAPVGTGSASIDFSLGQPTTESMNDFLREVDSLFASGAEDRPEPQGQSPRSDDARESAAATAAESVGQRVLTPALPPTPQESTTSTTGIMREDFHFPVSRIWVDVGIAAAALILGFAIGHSTKKADGISTFRFKPQPSSAVEPVAADPQKSDATSLLPHVQPKNLPVIIAQLNYTSTSDTTNVQITLQDSVNYEVHRISNPDRIYVDLWKAQVAPELLGKSIPVSQTLVSRVRIAQRGPEKARITLETKGVCDYSARILPSPYRLVITLSEQVPKKN
jgi:hypothetical protein